jgi:hypothetical protein
VTEPDDHHHTETRLPSPGTTFSQDKFFQIFRPLRQSLSALGFNRNYPTALLHAPRSQLGLDIPNFYMSQGIEPTNMLLSVGHLSNNLTGSVIRGSIGPISNCGAKVTSS